MKYSIIIPCYNECENVYNLIKQLDLLDYNYDIEWIMVENGSKDNTREKLETCCRSKSKYKIVYIDDNKGYGYGIKQGIKVAEGEYIGWIHADLQVLPINILESIKVTQETRGLFFIKGKRSNRSMSEYAFTFGMTLLASIILGKYIYDIGAIPVLFDRKLLNDTEINNAPNDFTFDTYIYYKAKKKEYEIIRIPVKMQLRKAGKSSWNNGLKSRIKLGCKILKGIIRIVKVERNRVHEQK